MNAALAPARQAGLFDDLITRHPEHLATRCAFCKAEPGRNCRDKNGTIVPGTHLARRSETRYRRDREPYLAELNQDDPSFGLRAGDTLLVLRDPASYRVRVLERMDDGYTPGIRVDLSSVTFLSFC